MPSWLTGPIAGSVTIPPGTSFNEPPWLNVTAARGLGLDDRATSWVPDDTSDALLPFVVFADHFAFSGGKVIDDSGNAAYARAAERGGVLRADGVGQRGLPRGSRPPIQRHGRGPGGRGWEQHRLARTRSSCRARRSRRSPQLRKLSRRWSNSRQQSAAIIDAGPAGHVRRGRRARPLRPDGSGRGRGQARRHARDVAHDDGARHRAHGVRRRGGHAPRSA